MTRTTVARTIEAPVEQVFDTVAHIESFSEAIPHITRVEFLSDIHTGVGTRFRETRTMRKREFTNDLEVTEYAADDHVRIVSDAGGTIWDTVFTVQPSGSGTELSMVMEARPYKLVARIITPLTSRMIKTAIEKDMDAVKRYCEQST